MKKSLLALAVLGTFAGAASAQTNVTIYGIVDAGINYDKGKFPEGKKWSLASGQYNGSRLGFKGTEDLGGGLSAIFTLENGFNVDDGTLGNSGRLFGRQAWVGLNGGFGTVKLGRQYSVMYNALALIDPFGINQAGDAQRVYGYGLGKVDPMSRSDNTVTYSTQDFAGFSGQAGYKFGETAGSFNTGSSKFVGANYTKGPLNVVAAYQNTDGVAFGATTTALGAIVAPTGLGAATARVKTGFIGTTYDFGVVKAHLGYGNTKADATGELKIRNYLVGFTAPVGTGSVYGSWNRNDIKQISAGASNQYAIGYSYPLSKRTLLYTSFAYTKNDSGVRLNAATNGQSDREFQAGFRHSF